jgi:hypothetical protein
MAILFVCITVLNLWTYMYYTQKQVIQPKVISTHASSKGVVLSNQQLNWLFMNQLVALQERYSIINYIESFNIRQENQEIHLDVLCLERTVSINIGYEANLQNEEIVVYIENIGLGRLKFTRPIKEFVINRITNNTDTFVITLPHFISIEELEVDGQVFFVLLNIENVTLEGLKKIFNP